MTSSFTTTSTTSFTVTHARHIAAKVATDLKRMQRFYREPTDGRILKYEAEVVALLKVGYLDVVTYGFKRDGDWIKPMLRYTAQYDIGSHFANDDPGRVLPGADISGATFASFLSYTNTWHGLTRGERAAFEAKLPFARTAGREPQVSGILVSDNMYSSGGRGVSRASIR